MRKFLKLFRSIAISATSIFTVLKLLPLRSPFGFKIGPSAILLITSTVAAHEAGHYFSARSQNLEVEPPIVISAGPIAIGLTKIKKYHRASKESKIFILRSGPLTGITFALALVIIFWFIGRKRQALTSLLIACKEFSSLFIGSDARKIRQQKAK